MPKAPPSFQFYAADWLTGTAGLSHPSKATFLLLLCYEWIQVDLIFDPPQLSRMIGISGEQFADHWSELQSKFTIDDDGYLRNAKLESVRSNALALSQKRKHAGQKGGRSKALAGLKPGSSKALAKLKQKPSKGRQKAKDLKGYTSKRVNNTKADRFEAFWKVYPKNESKKPARVAYEKAVADLIAKGRSPTDAMDYLLDRVTVFSKSEKGQSGQFCPLGTTWLNQARYDDDPSAWRRDGENSKPKAAKCRVPTKKDREHYDPNSPTGFVPGYIPEEQ